MREVTAPAPPDLVFPPPHDAFDHDEAPIAYIHERHGHDVRAALRQDAGRQSGDGSTRWSARAPLGGIRAGTLNEPRRHLSEKPLTIGEWERAYEIVVVEGGFRAWAAAALEHVAFAVAEMATREAGADDAITLVGRPVLGGPPTPLDRSIWATGRELRLRRLAACGLNVDAPFDPDAPVTHLIFATGDSVQEAVDAYAEHHRVPAVPNDHPWWTEQRAKIRGWAPNFVPVVRERLVVELLKPENRFWRLPQAQEWVRFQKDLGDGSHVLNGVVARVVEDLKRETRAGGPVYASLGKDGRPRHGMELKRKR